MVRIENLILSLKKAPIGKLVESIEMTSKKLNQMKVNFESSYKLLLNKKKNAINKPQGKLGE